MGRKLLVAEEESAVRLAARGVAEAATEVMPQKIQAWNHKTELMMECLDWGIRSKVNAIPL